MEFNGNEAVLAYKRKYRMQMYLPLGIIIPIYLVSSLSFYFQYGWRTAIGTFLIGGYFVFSLVKSMFKGIKTMGSVIDYMNVTENEIRFTTVGLSLFGGWIKCEASEKTLHKDEIVIKKSTLRYKGYLGTLDEVYIIESQSGENWLSRNMFDDFDRLKSSLEQFVGYKI